MFTDPISVTVNSVAQSMPRILIDGQKAVYQKSDGTFTLTISHQTTKDRRVRSTIRLEQKAVVTNPLDSTNDYDTLVFYCVMDRPSYGFSMAQCEQIIAGLQAYMTASIVDKLFGQEI